MDFQQADSLATRASLLERLKGLEIEYVHPLRKYEWQQRVVRIYDPDMHIIEIGESMAMIARRYLPADRIWKVDVPVDLERFNPDRVRSNLAKFNLQEGAAVGGIVARVQKHRRFEVILEAMQMVMNNLIDNAVKYSDGPPRISMRLSHTRRHVVIDFSDKGIGIAPKNLKHIFQKFHRINRQDAPTVKGTGLGLYWVREIIKAHGGKITVNSEGPHRGTSFSIELPIYRTARKRFVNQLLQYTQKRRMMRETRKI